ncbi:MAG: hypothetical protein MI810_11105, partial [Flavobacteriales bacterium]|nr:hypothetical protein [Flavobacteriales bacterium]
LDRTYRKFARISGILLVVLAFYGPSSINGRAVMHERTHLDESNFKKLIIQPSKHRGSSHLNLVWEDIEIEDPLKLEKFALLMKNVKEYYPSHVKGKNEWRCSMEVHTDKVIPFAMKRRQDETIVMVRSRGDYGWTYGDLIYTDELAVFVEELALANE